MVLSPDNILRQVITYQKSSLAYLENLNCFITNTNAKFKNFQDKEANLGSSVSFDLPYKFIATNGLQATFQGITQRIFNLTVDQASNVSFEVPNLEKIFNLGDKYYMNEIGAGCIKELSANIEKSIAFHANSSLPVNNVNGSIITPTGALHTESGPFRFFGDGYTALNSFQQLDQMIRNFKETGSVQKGIKVFLPNVIISPIIGSGLSQFVPRRNDELALSWELGTYGTPPVEYFESNLLPIHYAGDIGNADPETQKNVLTVVSVNDTTGNNVTQITCTCDASLASNANAIKSGDLCQFLDVGSQQYRALTFYGHAQTHQPVQFRILSDAASVGTTVVINIIADDDGGLCWVNGNPRQNMNIPIVSGAKISVLPSHQCGLVLSGDALYLAMPSLPEQTPYYTSSEYDSDFGVALRLTYGSIFGQSIQGFIYDAAWGSALLPRYCMRIVLPLV